MKKPEDMTPTEINAEILQLEEQRADIVARLGALRLYCARNVCPYRTGEVLVNKGGQRAVVKEIYARPPGYGDAYGMRGTYLLKNGTEGKRACHFYEWNDWKRP